MSRKRMLIVCSMMGDEVKAVLKEIEAENDDQIDVVMMEWGYHKDPDLLRKKLQEQIDLYQDYDDILLAYGLCGNGVAGLVSPNTRLLIPKFDDCINLMLCTSKRKSRGLTDPATFYLTNVWSKDEDSIINLYEQLMDEYDDEELAMDVVQSMFAHYKTISIIDTGNCDVDAAMEKAVRMRELLGLEVTVTPGSNGVLKELLLDDHSRNIIVLGPGEQVDISHFAWGRF